MDQIPVAIVKKKNARGSDTLVCMRLDVFAQWFLPPQDPCDCEPPQGLDCRKRGK